MLVAKDRLWYRVLKARYGEEGAVIGGRDTQFYVVENFVSHPWRREGTGVVNWFDDNVCRVVGDGKDTFF